MFWKPRLSCSVTKMSLMSQTWMIRGTPWGPKLGRGRGTGLIPLGAPTDITRTRCCARQGSDLRFACHDSFSHGNTNSKHYLPSVLFGDGPRHDHWAVCTGNTVSSSASSSQSSVRCSSIQARLTGFSASEGGMLLGLSRDPNGGELRGGGGGGGCRKDCCECVAASGEDPDGRRLCQWHVNDIRSLLAGR